MRRGLELLILLGSLLFGLRLKLLDLEIEFLFAHSHLRIGGFTLGFDLLSLDRRLTLLLFNLRLDHLGARRRRRRLGDLRLRVLLHFVNERLE